MSDLCSAQVDALAGMWNSSFHVTSACARGRQGDTSADKARRDSVHGASDRTSYGRTAVRPGKWGAATLGNRLSVFGAVLFENIAGSASRASQAAAVGRNHEIDNHGRFVAHSGGDVGLTAHQVLLPLLSDVDDCKHYQGDGFIFGPLIDLSPEDRIDISSVRTLLETAKGEEFYVVLEELGLFIERISGDLESSALVDERPMQLDHNDDDVVIASRKCEELRRESVLRLIALNEILCADTVRHCYDAQPVKMNCRDLREILLPTDWFVPDILHSSWKNFSLGWDLHEHCYIALAWSQPIEHLNAGRCVLHVYTDGSAQTGSAGWSVVVVAQDCSNGKCSFLGCFGGVLGGEADLGSNPSLTPCRQNKLRVAGRVYGCCHKLKPCKRLSIVFSFVGVAQVREKEQMVIAALLILRFLHR